MKGSQEQGKTQLLSDVDPLNGKSFKSEWDLKSTIPSFMFNSIEISMAVGLLIHMALPYIYIS